MSTQVIMPQLGESIHEGTIGKWLKQPGEPVEKYEPLVEIITDKVNAEIPSPIEGTLSLILAQEGQTVEIGAIIAEMIELSENITSPSSSPSQAAISEDEPTGSFPAGRAVAGWYEEKSILDGADDEAEEVVAATARSNRYSPAVRRLAEEHQLDLAALNLKGSGLGGRITRDDVLHYLAAKRQVEPAPAPLYQDSTPTPAIPKIDRYQPVVTAAMQVPLSGPALEIAATRAADQAPAVASAPRRAEPLIQDKAAFKPQPGGPAFTEAMFQPDSDELIALTPMRKAIAEHMARSKQTTPHAWTIVEVDMTRLVQHRARIKAEFRQREGLDLTYLPFVLKAVAEGLRQFPQLNAVWSPEQGGVLVKRELNLGVAVDVPDGLIVPVVHRAEEKTLVGLARSLQDLVNRARAKKLTLADVQGGTFTVTNPGAFGSVLSYPIINQPQAGIVTMEAIVKRPVVLSDAEGNDTIAVRSMMNMCLSFDHRVVDGAYAGRFLQFVKGWLEQEATKQV